MSCVNDHLMKLLGFVVFVVRVLGSRPLSGRLLFVPAGFVVVRLRVQAGGEPGIDGGQVGVIDFDLFGDFQGLITIDPNHS